MNGPQALAVRAARARRSDLVHPRRGHPRVDPRLACLARLRAGGEPGELGQSSGDLSQRLAAGRAPSRSGAAQHGRACSPRRNRSSEPEFSAFATAVKLLGAGFPRSAASSGCAAPRIAAGACTRPRARAGPRRGGALRPVGGPRHGAAGRRATATRRCSPRPTRRARRARRPGHGAAGVRGGRALRMRFRCAGRGASWAGWR